mmetsp:Transcript_12618/g.38719  ORF Transcript_12618/g.38719 Transcript_12618/m.38719 type:complete len:189 (-) Transcript_12618:25-591(-)
MAQPAGEKLGFGYFAGLLGGVAAVLVCQRAARRVPKALDSDDDASDDEEGAPLVAGARWGLRDAPYKMLLCINCDLRDEAGNRTKMKPGKAAAQCCHAVLGCYRRAQRRAPAALRWWAATGQAKVCVKVPAEAELLELRARLAAAGVVSYLVEDAGRTQVAPGSRTVLAVGPAPVRVLDPLTRHLKLY